MLVAMARARLALGQDLIDSNSIKLIKDSTSPFLSSIEDEKLEQIVAVANVAALEDASESNVEAANPIMEQLRELRELLIETLGESSIEVENLNDIISQVQAQEP